MSTSPFRAAVVTDVGRTRSANEDAGLADEARGLLVVADGMGGKAAGETASRMVVEALPSLLDGGLAAAVSDDDVAGTLSRSLETVSGEIYRAGAADPTLSGMGATTVVALLRGSRLHLAHVGDSRAYLLRDGALTQLTQDHTLLAMLMEKGLVKAEEVVPGHPSASTLTRHVGREKFIAPDVRHLDLVAGDRLLLASDGLTNMVPDPSLAAMLGNGDDPEATCRAMIDAANEAGGADNITAIVAHFG